MGNFHHGDKAIYDALARLAQEFIEISSHRGSR